MTPRQRNLARHALGLPNAKDRSYRNHYVCGPAGETFLVWTEMVARGLATTDGPRAYFNRGSCFHLTLASASAALGPGEMLDEEDFPRAQSA